MKSLMEYKNLIESNPCHLATVRKNGTPNLAVAADIKLIDDNDILISCNEMVNTPVNITPPHPHNIVLTSFNSDWVGVRITGTATFYESGKYFELCNHYFKNDECQPKGAIVIKVENFEDFK